VTDNSKGDDGSSGQRAPQDAAASKGGLTRRGILQAIGGGTVGAALGVGLPGVAASQGNAAQTVAASTTARLPYESVRVIELSQTLTGRLTGLLLADQGAEVYAERPKPSGQFDDAYFDRGKKLLPAGALADTSSADVIIVDGDAPVKRLPHQTVMRVVAALPGDADYGFLPPDCSEDLIGALVGFFTNMSVTGPMLGRPVIYTPLPLASVYAGVNGAVAVASVLVDRERTGLGREVHASRIAGGLSAIGALALTSSGLPPHLAPIVVGGLPPGLEPAQAKVIMANARAEPAGQLWLEQRVAPLSAPYRCADGQFLLPMAAPNRRLTRRALEALGLWDKALAAGMVDVNTFDPANLPNRHNNLADSLALRFDLTSQLADWLEPIFASRSAAEWDRFLQANGVAVAIIGTWQDWLVHRTARETGIIDKVAGDPHVRVGRTSWVESAQPYPALAVGQKLRALPPRTSPVPKATGVAPAKFPLAGYTMLDVTNVLAGPSCGRMFAELGATVVQSFQPEPNGSPTIVVDWAGEVACGKRTIIIDVRNPDGAKVMAQLAATADLVLANKMDGQIVRLGLDPATLKRSNPKCIGLQVTAFRGERRGPQDNDIGFDPSIQGPTGIMERFGNKGAPTYHGVASCVDYLCGYLAAFAGVTALYAREHRKDGKGDWAQASLAPSATLTQLLLTGVPKPPDDIRGQYSTGRNAGERVYQLSDGWIFVQGKTDMTAELSGKTQAQALAHAKGMGLLAVPVQTCRQVADRHTDKPSPTVYFEKRESDGWVNHCFRPTWFTFDGVPTPRARATSRIGADGPAVLAQLGYSADDVKRMVASGAIGRTEWAKA
jgi:crotonobetainyl-CoA:carnitine CoA-transferase CaiB-like acyl-CoA transferase